MTVANQRNPVLFVHGIDDNYARFKTMTDHLVERGWTVYGLDLLPNNGDLGLDKLATQVSDYAKRVFAPDQPFDLIGFSMGSIVSRYYLQRLRGIEQVQRFVAIAAPHHGTLTAYFRPNEGGAQLRPNSPFLQRLNQDVIMLKRIQVTNVWTPLDLMIVPANSSRLPFGDEVVVNVALHPWMLSDPRSITAVEQALRQPLREQSIKNPK